MTRALPACGPARLLTPVVLLAGLLALGACNARPDTGAEDTRKQIDQMSATLKDIAGQARVAAESGKASADQLRALSGQVEELHKAVTTGFASQKRGALPLRLETDVTCDNDADCSATARAACNRVNYPNAIAAHFTPGLRPTLQSLVCFD